MRANSPVRMDLRVGWRCVKLGHVQRNCRGRNSSGAVAAIAQNREPPVRVLDQKEVEAKVIQEREGRSTDREIRSGSTGVVGEGEATPSAKETASKGKEETAEGRRESSYKSYFVGKTKF